MASPQQHIPFGRNSSHFAKIQNSLALVLYDIKSIPALAGKILWVSCRLNRTGEKDSPVFVGWVEDIQAIRRRVHNGYPYSPIEIRFGDTHPSTLYTECLSKGSGELIRRKWSPQQRADPTSQEIGIKFYNETDRRSVPIKIADQSVGTLNAAFGDDPSAEDTNIEKILFRWAQTRSGLVTYIEDNLEYSPGP